MKRKIKLIIFVIPTAKISGGLLSHGKVKRNIVYFVDGFYQNLSNHSPPPPFPLHICTYINIHIVCQFNIQCNELPYYTEHNNCDRFDPLFITIDVDIYLCLVSLYIFIYVQCITNTFPEWKLHSYYIEKRCCAIASPNE